MSEQTETPARGEVREGLTLDFRAIFEASPELLLVLLPDAPKYTVVAATDARLAATHATREGTIGQQLFDLFPDNPDDPSATGSSHLRASLDRVLATGAADTMAVQRYDIRGPSGSFETRYWSPKNVPLLSPTGRVLAILHRVEDVTELVHATELGEELRDKTRVMEREVLARSRELAAANRELRAANAKLGELDLAKSAFFSNVSHEFRTPLTLILGPVEDVLRRGEALDGEGLRAVHRSAVRLGRLVNTLLDFSSLEAGRLLSRFEPTDLAELTAGLAGAFQSLVESAGLRLVVDCPPLQQQVFVDPAHWERIVSNLVSNAFKFTLEGEISVRLREYPDRVELLVHDTGTGIPEDHLHRIFERFHRAGQAGGRSFEGTGIGLALVKELVDQHGGSVLVDSLVGRGTTFTVSLPLGCAHLPADRLATPIVGSSAPGGAGAAAFVLEASQWVPPSPPDAPEPSTAKRRERILVVDDNADMRSHIAGLLSRQWTVDAAADGLGALDVVRLAPPDLILSDVMMPRMDGFALVAALRASPATRKIPVILLSARSGEEAVVEGIEAGADGYLPKPFSARELVTRVRGFLDATRTRTSALRASETRLRRLSEAGIVGICVSDADGRIQEANDTFLEMLGCSREELTDPEGTWQFRAPTRPPGVSGSRAWEDEYRLENGRRIPVLVAVAPLEDGETIAIALDLSETKKLQEQFRQAQKMEAVGRLAGAIAHDFNNLLSVILGYSELICADLPPDEPLRESIEEIREAAVRATDLTKQLLAFSRQQSLELKVLSLNRSVTGISAMLHRLLGADVALTVLPEPGLWSIEADPGQIEQVLMNLVVNARDAMPTGGKLTIRTANVELEEGYSAVHHDVVPGSYVLLAVSDTGVGMDAATQAHIFEPFFTTKEKGKGTGLGLSTVFGIVKQSGGHIWVYSEPGMGTTFKLYFPRAAGPEPAVQQPRPLEPVRGHETVLLVEDEPQVRALASTILRRAGYVVLEAANGGEAILVCEQHPARIDVLLTDVVLPLVSGRELAQRLRALRPELKVLFMSGYTEDAVFQHGHLDAGMAYLQKPLTPVALTRGLRAVLERPSRGHA